ncbi:hypothetical protein [Streptomyces sp. NPDC004685]
MQQLAVFAAACLAFLSVAPTAAGAPVGDCTATMGAIVAVDVEPFGGMIERGCDTTPTTGYEFLHEGGFIIAGTERDGPRLHLSHRLRIYQLRYPVPDSGQGCLPTDSAGHCLLVVLGFGGADVERVIAHVAAVGDVLDVVLTPEPDEDDDGQA